MLAGELYDPFDAELVTAREHFAGLLRGLRRCETTLRAIGIAYWRIIAATGLSSTLPADAAARASHASIL
ncbi:maltose acetyltransferase domain-containing protein [Noviherbaspirillum sp. Root189]|uniref:maltose acetyltransferase domain-containing protein n=1 Tax=Noviherbaspirillum sp. Root189 TaxID=1736487 RepID=UPI0009E9B7D9